jgi:hypothetical protein
MRAVYGSVWQVYGTLRPHHPLSVLLYLLKQLTQSGPHCHRLLEASGGFLKVIVVGMRPTEHGVGVGKRGVEFDGGLMEFDGSVERWTVRGLERE